MLGPDGRALAWHVRVSYDAEEVSTCKIVYEEKHVNFNEDDMGITSTSLQIPKLIVEASAMPASSDNDSQYIEIVRKPFPLESSMHSKMEDARLTRAAAKRANNVAPLSRKRRKTSKCDVEQDNDGNTSSDDGPDPADPPPTECNEQ